MSAPNEIKDLRIDSPYSELKIAVENFTLTKGTSKSKPMLRMDICVYSKDAKLLTSTGWRVFAGMLQPPSYKLKTGKFFPLATVSDRLNEAIFDAIRLKCGPLFPDIEWTAPEPEKDLPFTFDGVPGVSQ